MSFVDEMNFKTAENDVYFFTTEILGLELKQFHKQWLHNLLNHKRTLNICSRDHGKSFISSMAFPLWTTLFSPEQILTPQVSNCDTLIISNSLDQSQMLIDRIKTIIENTEILNSLNWSRGNKNLIELNEKDNHNKIESRSFGSSVRGMHPLICVIDDPLSENSSMTADAIEEFFFSSISNLCHAEAILSVIGTRFSATDLYSKLMEPERAYKLAVYPALNSANEPLWPERYSYENLMKKRAEIGSYAFAREFMCEPMSDDDSIFPRDLLKSCLSKDYTFETESDGKSRYLISVDFAIGTTSSSDYSVVTVLKDDREGNISIVDIWREKGKEYDVQIDAIRDRYERFDPVQIHVENNVFQAVFQQILAKEHLPVVGIPTTKQGKENNTFLLRSLMENNKITLPYGNTITRKMIDELMFELGSFGYRNDKLQGLGKNDDMVMSLIIGTKGVTNFSGGSVSGKAGGFSKADNILDINFDMQNNKFNSPWDSNLISGLGIK